MEIEENLNSGAFTGLENSLRASWPLYIGFKRITGFVRADSFVSSVLYYSNTNQMG